MDAFDAVRGGMVKDAVFVVYAVFGGPHNAYKSQTWLLEVLLLECSLGELLGVVLRREAARHAVLVLRAAAVRK
jgi:hypothetical protein